MFVDGGLERFFGSKEQPRFTSRCTVFYYQNVLVLQYSCCRLAKKFRRYIGFYIAYDRTVRPNVLSAD